jgi:hypothetical protein
MPMERNHPAWGCTPMAHRRIGPVSAWLGVSLVRLCRPRVICEPEYFHQDILARLQALLTFKIPGEQIRRLIPNLGGCFASDRITVDGAPVGYMYREEPDGHHSTS